MNRIGTEPSGPDRPSHLPSVQSVQSVVKTRRSPTRRVRFSPRIARMNRIRMEPSGPDRPSHLPSVVSVRSVVKTRRSPTRRVRFSPRIARIARMNRIRIGPSGPDRPSHLPSVVSVRSVVKTRRAPARLVRVARSHIGYCPARADFIPGRGRTIAMVVGFRGHSLCRGLAMRMSPRSRVSPGLTVNSLRTMSSRPSTAGV